MPNIPNTISVVATRGQDKLSGRKNEAENRSSGVQESEVRSQELQKVAKLTNGFRI
jgi:hypothetical protein